MLVALIYLTVVLILAGFVAVAAWLLRPSDED